MREWKQSRPGAKVIAYFPVYAPVELIHAAGMLPVSLYGAGDRLDIQHADARFGSFICSIVKTTLEMGLTGHLEPFDGFLFSTICDSARNLCFVMRRNLPAMYVDFLRLPHNPSSPAAALFLAEEYRRILFELERLGACKVHDDAVRHSITVYNHHRALIRKLYEVRTRYPEKVSTGELYQLIRAGSSLPVEEHTAQLETALAQFCSRSVKKRDSIRIVVEGSFCEQPPLTLIQLIEDAGCYIVDDDFVIGQSWFEGDVPTEGDPLLSLATSYLDRSVYSSVRHDFRKPRWDGLVQKVRRSKADAVLFLIAKFCEPAYFDYVPYKQELERAGIPHLQLEFEEKSFTFDRLRTEIETFVESLIFD
ncbi:MAG TPA: 2-hydroxyacyl-CoA dehydratase [Terriglobales bacterium]|nr:2-hydroxyacyl-CoA dehydratase [Terriglobales bacterium]